MENTHKDFLMKEYDYYNTLFRQNEDTGEKRLTYYNTLAAGVMGGVVALLNTHLDPAKSLLSKDLVYFIAVMALVGLFFVGNVIFWRLVKRNHTTDCYKIQLDNIREAYAMADPSVRPLIEKNKECRNAMNAKRDGWSTKLTSLVHITSVLNALILCLIITIGLYGYTGIWNAGLSLLVGGIFLVSLAVYYKGSKR